MNSGPHAPDASQMVDGAEKNTRRKGGRGTLHIIEQNRSMLAVNKHLKEARQVRRCCLLDGSLTGAIPEC